MEKLYTNDKFFFELSCIYTTGLLFIVLWAVIESPLSKGYPNLCVFLMLFGWYLVVRWRLTVHQKEGYRSGHKDGCNDIKGIKD